MSKILFLKPQNATRARCPVNRSEAAEIIFFPGVRYEPLHEGGPVQRGIGRRWTLEPTGSRTS